MMEIRIWNQIIRNGDDWRWLTQTEIDQLIFWGEKVRNDEKLIPFGPFLDKYWQIFPDGLITIN